MEQLSEHPGFAVYREALNSLCRSLRLSALTDSFGEGLQSLATALRRNGQITGLQMALQLLDLLLADVNQDIDTVAAALRGEEVTENA